MVLSVARRVSYSWTQIFEDYHCKQSMCVEDKTCLFWSGTLECSWLERTNAGMKQGE